MSVENGYIYDKFSDQIEEFIETVGEEDALRFLKSFLSDYTPAERKSKLIYLDVKQCNQFKCEYFGYSSFSIDLETLMKSKDYDSEHKKFFELFRNTAVMNLTRDEEYQPGWYLCREED